MCAIFKITLDKNPEIFNKLKDRYGEDTAREYLDKTLYPKGKAPVLNKEEKVAIMDWGFPLYSKNQVLFNARVESLKTKKLYSDILKNHIIIPASAFYEYSTLKENKKKYIFTLDKDLFYFAGLWKKVINKEGEKTFAFTIITTAPNVQMSEIHSRMPVILNEETKNIWLTNDTISDNILKPFQGEMKIKEAV